LQCYCSVVVVVSNVAVVVVVVVVDDTIQAYQLILSASATPRNQNKTEINEETVYVILSSPFWH